LDDPVHVLDIDDVGASAGAGQAQELIWIFDRRSTSGV